MTRPSMGDWIAQVLSNDENSSDAELVEYFVQEGPMSPQTAQECVGLRDKFLRLESPELPPLPDGSKNPYAGIDFRKYI